MANVCARLLPSYCDTWLFGSGRFRVILDAFILGEGAAFLRREQGG